MTITPAGPIYLLFFLACGTAFPSRDRESIANYNGRILKPADLRTSGKRRTSGVDRDICHSSKRCSKSYHLRSSDKSENLMWTRGGARTNRQFVESLARVLGYCVTAGSFTLKIPQIVKCAKARSVEGLSFASNYLEMQCYLGSSVYHYLNRYPISTWAENLSLGAQQLVLILLMWNFTSDPSAASKCNIAAVVVLQLGFLACSMVLPKRLWPLLLGFTGVLALVSNVAQIMLTYDTADLGQLSWATTLLRLAGCLVRMFTTFVLASEDTTLLLLFAMVFGLNAIQAAQLVIYR